MADYDKRLEDDVVDESEVVAKKTKDTAKDVAKSPKRIKDTVDNVKDTAEKFKDYSNEGDLSSRSKTPSESGKNMSNASKDTAEATKNAAENSKDAVKEVKNATKDAGEVAKDTEKAAKEATKAAEESAKTAKQAAKAAKEAAKAAGKAGAEATKAAGEAVKTAAEVGAEGVGIAAGAAAAPETLGASIAIGYLAPKALEDQVRRTTKPITDKADTLKNISTLAKAKNMSEDMDAAEDIAKEKIKKKTEDKIKEKTNPITHARKKGEKILRKINVALFIWMIPFIIMLLLVLSAAGFIFTGNSIGLSSLNYAFGDKGTYETINLTELTEYTYVDKNNDVVFDVEFTMTITDPITGEEKEITLLKIFENFGYFLSYADKFNIYFFKDGNKTCVSIANLVKNIERFLAGEKFLSISDTEIENIANKRDYSAMMNLYADYVDEYLEKALQSQRASWS